MISIIVPIYNIDTYLRQCIESLVSQTYVDIEVILVDDGSTDLCYDICEEYKKRDSRVQVIHKKNGGQVSARKAGLKVANGEYIAFVDGDDWVDPAMYVLMLKKLEEEAVDVVMCGRYEDTGACSKKVCHGIKEGRYDKSRMISEIYPRMLVGGDFFEWGIFPGVWDKLFRKECIYPCQMNVDDFIIMGDDAACVYPCLLLADSIYVMGDCYYHYRQTTVSTIKQIRQDGQDKRRYRLLFQSVNHFFTENVQIYDLREQWLQYMLFLMVPRADSLYKDVEALDYLFPFPKVKRNSRIILYCAGTYGQRLYQYIQRTGYCEIAAWVDQNYVELSRQGLPVESTDVIFDKEYDAIVIANVFASAKREIYRKLMAKCPERKVYLMDEKLIKSHETLQAFGLI